MNTTESSVATETVAVVAGVAAADETRHLLQAWLTRGWIAPMDYALGIYLMQSEPQSAQIAPVASLLAGWLQGGHSCLALHDMRSILTALQPREHVAARAVLEPVHRVNDDVELEKTSLRVPTPAQWWASRPVSAWRDLLQASGLVAEVAVEDTRDTLEAVAPLVLQGDLLYFHRLWRQEARVGNAIAHRLGFVPVDEAFVSALNALFVPLGEDRIDWQKVACAMAASGDFTIITGGPGTGKTTTVVRLLAALQEEAVQVQGKFLNIALAAPTGKAAARLSESIAAQISDLPVSDSVRAHIPSTVSTLHRLLGARADSRTFRHNPQNPLALDIVVVDEASMVDLEMMDNLLQALAPGTRLILLGDKDQLASVEAGAVLGEMCENAERMLYTPQTTAVLSDLSGESLVSPLRESADQDVRATPLDQRVVMLRHSHRFAQDSGIGQLAQAINDRHPDRVIALLEQELPDLDWHALLEEDTSALSPLITQGYAPFVNALRQGANLAAEDDGFVAWAHTLLEAFDAFRLLCAVREGQLGTVMLNQRVERLLAAHLGVASESPWYHGRPVMVTRNDYSLNLMNGDIGITLALPMQDGSGTALRVVFASPEHDGGIRLVPASRLSAIETVFAMTVHKSQGSEFLHCALVLPDVMNPVLTKELLYTGVTRARQKLTLVASTEVLRESVLRRVARRSGLRHRLQVDSSI